MNYNLHYNLLIQKAKERIQPLIVEMHHILPKSMGGTDAKENIVALSPKEHFIAHHLLWKIHKNRSMHFAFWLMVTKCNRNGKNDNKKDYKINSRIYEKAKEQHRIEVSKIHRGKIRTEEERQKSSISLKGKPAWNKGLIDIYSEETLKKMKESATGRKDSLETQKKRSESAKRRPMPENIYSIESKEKRKKSNKEWRNKNQMTCPHCNKTGVKYNIERYHFDNCPIINPNKTMVSKSKGISLTKHKCPHCNMETSMGNLKRWHFNNCKRIKNNAIR